MMIREKVYAWVCYEDGDGCDVMAMTLVSFDFCNGTDVMMRERLEYRDMWLRGMKIGRKV